jgi:hypothetical protein
MLCSNLKKRANLHFIPFPPPPPPPPPPPHTHTHRHKQTNAEVTFCHVPVCLVLIGFAEECSTVVL